jgi:predicted DNA-binding transcriptional regulator AlpA
MSDVVTKLQRLVRRKEVLDFLRLKSPSNLDEIIKRGGFPPPFSIDGGPRRNGATVAWLESDLLEWIEKRKAERDAAMAAQRAQAAERPPRKRGRPARKAVR